MYAISLNPAADYLCGHFTLEKRQLQVGKCKYLGEAANCGSAENAGGQAELHKGRIGNPIGLHEGKRDASEGFWQTFSSRKSRDAASQEVLDKPLAEVEQALKLWEQAYAEGQETVKNTPVRQGTGDGVERYMMSKSEYDTIKEQLTANQWKLVDMEPVADISDMRDIRIKTGQVKDRVVSDLKQTGYMVDRQGFGIIEFSEKEINTRVYLKSPQDCIISTKCK